MLIKLDKKRKLIIAAIIVVISLIVVAIVFSRVKKTYTCYADYDLLDGIRENDTIKIITKNDNIYKISMNQNILLDSFYGSESAYYNSIKKVLDVIYEKVDHKITSDKKEHKINVLVNDSKYGIVLKNLIIKQNGKDNKTLRYDGITDLKSDNALKIGTKFDIEKLKKNGYKC